MKTLKLFALAVAICGLFAVEANAGGGRRSRGCSSGSCATTTSCCSGTSCATPAATKVETKTEAPKTEAPKVVEGKPVEKAVVTSTCTSGSCGSEVTCNSRRSRGCRGGRCR
jgi:hypothetical protein